jgi:hypothetical protein
MNTTNWKTRAAFSFNGGCTWVWHTWRHNHGNKHAAIIEKAAELGAKTWDYSQADHGEAGRVNF